MGTVAPEVVKAILRHLHASHIQTAQWEGYADIEAPSGDRVTFPPQRASIVRTVASGELRNAGRVPMRWWDPDLTWTLGNDIYARSVFISGSSQLITALLADAALESFSVDYRDPVTAEDR